MIFETPQSPRTLDNYRELKSGMSLKVLTKHYGGTLQAKPILVDLGKVEACLPLYNQLVLLVSAHVVATLARSHSMIHKTPGVWEGAMFEQPSVLAADRLLESAAGGGTEELAFQVAVNAYCGRLPAASQEVSGMQKAQSGIEELGGLLFGDYRHTLCFNGTYMTSAVLRAKDGLKMLRRRGLDLPNRAQFDAFLVHLGHAIGMLTVEGDSGPAS